jgi:diacylglycerol kinase (ATP)
MKKLLLVYNPSSGVQFFKDHIDWVLSEFSRHNIWCIPLRLDEFNQKKLLTYTKTLSFDMLAVSGGDGTLNFMVSLLMKNNIDIPVGLIPTGTCNDFAASLNMGNSIEESVKRIIKQKIRRLDVGVINNSKYFLSTFAAGSFVDVSYSTHSEFKKNFGRMAYIFNAVADFKNIKPFRMNVKTNEENFEIEVLMFMIFNGKQGGGFQNLIKGIDLSDGLMDIAFLKNSSTIDLASVVIQILSGEPINNKVVKIVKTSHCEVEILERNRKIKTSIDGEKGPKFPLKIDFLKQRQKFYV